MNLSLKNRVALSFVLANAMVLVLGFTVFFFLKSLNEKILEITARSNKISVLTDEIRISAVNILKLQRNILTGQPSQEKIDKLMGRCEGFTGQLQYLDTLYQDVEVKKIIAKMLGYVESLQLVLQKAGPFGRETNGLSSIADLADKILDAYSEFQDIHYLQNQERDSEIKKIINDTKKNMMYTLIITFIGCILLALMIPGKIALPFKKIKDAMTELQECNFDVNIYYNQNDEIGEVAREMNKMILGLKKFEELRTDRISVEKRKFDALANLSDLNVMVSNAKGELVYLNNQLYSLLSLQSDDLLFKNMADTLVPDSIKESFELAIKRRSKIENAEIKIPHRATEKEEAKGGAKEWEFEGFANVIPIRGKESGLDYYLMVISPEVFS